MNSARARSRVLGDIAGKSKSGNSNSPGGTSEGGPVLFDSFENDTATSSASSSSMFLSSSSAIFCFCSSSLSKTLCRRLSLAWKRVTSSCASFISFYAFFRAISSRTISAEEITRSHFYPLDTYREHRLESGPVIHSLGLFL